MALFRRKQNNHDENNDGEGKKGKAGSKEPANTAFKQQRLKAWQPILTPKTVLPVLFIVGLCFAPIGGLLIWGSGNPKITIEYTGCESAGQSFTNLPKFSYKMRSSASDAVASTPQWRSTKVNSTLTSSGNQCTIAFDIPADLEPPVFLYYRLTSFYQNHRRYPLAVLDGKIVYPCGLIANSMFNDTIGNATLLGTNNNNLYAFSSKNIAWPGEARKYATRPGYANLSEIIPPPNWRHRYPNGYTDTDVPDLKANEHFQNWMRTAGLPTFTKLYGRNDNETMRQGRYEIVIDDNFPVSQFGGTKAIVISTVSWIGGKNPFLGWAYIAVAALFVLLGIAGTARHLLRPRPKELLNHIEGFEYRLTTGSISLIEFAPVGPGRDVADVSTQHSKFGAAGQYFFRQPPIIFPLPFDTCDDPRDVWRCFFDTMSTSFWKDPRAGTKTIIDGVRENKNAYIMAAWAAMGGMYFGWDSGLIGGILSEKAFEVAFGLDKVESTALAALKGNIVSVLQAGGTPAVRYLYFLYWLHHSVNDSLKRTVSAARFGPTLRRAIGGFGVGLASSVIPTYISECAPREIRGRLTGMYQLMNVTGVMLSFWTNYGLQTNAKSELDHWTWRAAFIIQMAPGAVMTVGMLTQPESPRYLVQRGRIEEAAHSLGRLRGRPADDPAVRGVLSEIIADFEGRAHLNLWQQCKASFKDATTFYRVFISIILMFFQQWTGTNAINIYSPQIFASLGITGTSSGLFATGIYGVVKVFCTSLALMFALEQAGRKMSLIGGGLIQAVSMYYIGIYQAVHTSGTVVPASYAAITFVYVFVLGYSFGWGSVPWAVMAECAPNHLRSLAMALGLMTNWLFNFVISKITPTLLATIGFGTFLLFGSFSIVMVLWTIFFLPETKGIALEHIHEVFEEPIVKRSLADMRPSRARARRAEVLQGTAETDAYGQMEDGSVGDSQKAKVEQIENRI
ncbi:Permeases of the major facilitator superfamily [Rhizoctonia solani]|uniref:Permeases of the major facilitator superfamily n=1 Tax=Rhizoctonia solani TaxID=456999 RepID=A0A8H7I9M3_9AGAM|nr:Permeases of the major facilitator superfamily [Rhizoctonia solani]